MQSFEAYLAETRAAGKLAALQKENRLLRRDCDRLRSDLATVKRRASEQRDLVAAQGQVEWLQKRIDRLAGGRDALKKQVGCLTAEKVTMRTHIDQLTHELRKQTAPNFASMDLASFETHLNMVEDAARQRYMAILTQEGFHPGWDGWPPSVTIGEVKFRRLRSDLEMRCAGWISRNCLHYASQPYLERQRTGKRGYFAIITKGFCSGVVELKRDEIGEIVISQQQGFNNGVLADAVTAALQQFVGWYARKPKS